VNNGTLSGVTRPGPTARVWNQQPVVSFLGDSITVNGGTKTVIGTFNGTGQCWQQWASMLSGGRFFVGSVIGGGSLTTLRIQQQHLNTIVNDAIEARRFGIRVGYCVVLAGTNDAGNSIEFGQTKQAFNRIFDTLVAAGIEPILCTLTPRSGAIAYQRINSFLRYTAMTRGWKLIDFAIAPTLAHNNDGTWLSGLSDDAVHPNEAGAKAMGQVVADTFNEWGILGRGLPWITNANADGLNLVSTTNSLLITDTNADGTPDGWTLTGAGATSALAASATPGLGNRMTVTRASASTTQLSTSFNSTGDNLYVATMRCESTVAGTTPSVQFGAMATASRRYTFTTGVDVPAGSVLTGLVYHPTTYSTQSGVTISAGDGTVARITQPTIYNLTAARSIGH
jgi:lysophospholipase L1-like esterase